MGTVRKTMQVLLVCLTALLGHVAADVLEFHNGPRRDGFYVDAAFTPANIAAATLDTNFAANVVVPGPVYAQSLFLTVEGRGLIILATEQAIVLAVDAATGEEAWRTPLGTPVPLASLQCGNIDPYAVTGTPAIDDVTGMIYVDSLLLINGTVTHSIFTIYGATGEILPNTVNVSQELAAQGITFDPTIQNQRGGLTLMNGTLYVPYGGYNGDCGNYHGVVVGVDLADYSVKAWVTAGLKGGSWSPGGAANDGHFVYVGTGNTDDATVWGGGEGVIKLEPGPVFTNATTDFFAPANWVALDAADTDIGSSGPVLVDVPGASPSALVVEMGKNGAVYLLDRNNLGGFGHEVFSAVVGSKVIINAPSAYNSTSGQYLTLVTFGQIVQCPPRQAGNLAGLLLAAGSPPSFSVAWCALFTGHGTPISVSPDGSSNASVWAIAAETTNALMAFDGDTGKPLYTSANLTAVARYSAPMVNEGTVYVVSNTTLYAFRVGATAGAPIPSPAALPAGAPGS